MTKHWVIVSSTAVAVAIGGALVLRPSRTLKPDVPLPVPEHLPAEVRAVLQERMQRHGAEMSELIMRLVVLDHDGAARVAGKVYDEPGVAASAGGAALKRQLPSRFFALEAELKAEARSIVAAAAQRSPEGQAEHFAALTRTCVRCHEAYLYERPDQRDVEVSAWGRTR